MALSRVTTGVPGLDECIEGGLPLSRSILVCGETGTGKTLFGIQFLVEGIRQGQAGVLVSVDEKPQHIIESAARFGWDLRGATDRGRLALLHASPYFTASRGKHPLDARQIASDLTQQIRDLDARRLVIDSLTSLVAQDTPVAQVSNFLRALLFSLEDNLGCTMLLTAGTSASSDHQGVYGIAEVMAAGVIELKMAGAPTGFGRSLFIRKMRATAIDLAEHAFDIVPNRGLVLR